MDASALKWRQLFGSLLPPMRVAYYGGVVSITTYMDTALWQLLKNDFFQALPKLPLPPYNAKNITVYPETLFVFHVVLT